MANYPIHLVEIEAFAPLPPALKSRFLKFFLFLFLPAFKTFSALQKTRNIEAFAGHSAKGRGARESLCAKVNSGKLEIENLVYQTKGGIMKKGKFHFLSTCVLGFLSSYLNSFTLQR